ncbi:hypothetical protein J3458_020522 [Metarhizium acridum]|uniref:uncharacterized protein n=1 Tax=Metarhizium acridum TaxID=92637 RepID=UPI001C6AB910|nr:hypothetical protein J3458_020522 [Metarhizium acridum]
MFLRVLPDSGLHCSPGPSHGPHFSRHDLASTPPATTHPSAMNQPCSSHPRRIRPQPSTTVHNQHPNNATAPTQPALRRALQPLTAQRWPPGGPQFCAFFCRFLVAKRHNARSARPLASQLPIGPAGKTKHGNKDPLRGPMPTDCFGHFCYYPWYSSRLFFFFFFFIFFRFYLSPHTCSGLSFVLTSVGT